MSATSDCFVWDLDYLGVSDLALPNGGFVLRDALRAWQRPTSALVPGMAKNRPSKQERLRSVDRIALTIEEAAESIGLGQRAFEDHILPHCPKLHAGRRIVIPKQLFEKHIEKLAVEEAEQTEETAVELLARTESSSR